MGKTTYGIDLARVVLNYLDKPKFFNHICYNYAQSGFTTWYDWSKKIIELSKIKCKIKKCSTEEYPKIANRPIFSVLDTKLIENHLSLSIKTWENALERCLKRIENNEKF